MLVCGLYSRQFTVRSLNLNNRNNTQRSGVGLPTIPAVELWFGYYLLFILGSLHFIMTLVIVFTYFLVNWPNFYFIPNFVYFLVNWPNFYFISNFVYKIRYSVHTLNCIWIQSASCKLKDTALNGSECTSLFKTIILAFSYMNKGNDSYVIQF